MLKKILIIMVSIVFCIGIAGYLVYRSVEKQRAELVPQLNLVVRDFHACNEAKKDCSAFLTEEFRANAPYEKRQMHNKFIQSKLGKRLTAEMDVNSIAYQTFNSVGSSKMVSRARFKAMYENDINVSEQYEFVDSGAGFLIQGISVNSDTLFK